MGILFWIFVAIAVIAALTMFSQSTGAEASKAGAVAIISLATSANLAVPLFGYGNVPSNVEEFADRLDNRIAYELASSARDGASYVILLKEFGTSNYKAIRTNTVPPEIFTLVSGKPVAIQK